MIHSDEELHWKCCKGLHCNCFHPCTQLIEHNFQMHALETLRTNFKVIYFTFFTSSTCRWFFFMIVACIELTTLLDSKLPIVRMEVVCIFLEIKPILMPLMAPMFYWRFFTFMLLSFILHFFLLYYSKVTQSIIETKRVCECVICRTIWIDGTNNKPIKCHKCC